MNGIIHKARILKVLTDEENVSYFMNSQWEYTSSVCVGIVMSLKYNGCNKIALVQRNNLLKETWYGKLLRFKD